MNNYSGFATLATTFLLALAGRDFPKLPAVIFPRLVRLSPLPIFIILSANVKKKQGNQRPLPFLFLT